MYTKHVLVIEDNRAYRDAMLDGLKGLQTENEFDWDYAGEVKQAKQKIDEKMFHVLIVDLSIPNSELGGIDDQGGIRVIEYAKERNPMVKSIVLTSHAEYDNLLACLRVHAFDFIDREIHDLDMLIAILRRACKCYERDNELGELASYYIHLHGCPIDHKDHRCNRTNEILGEQSGTRVFVALPVRDKNLDKEDAIRQVWEHAGMTAFTDMMEMQGGEKLCEICFRIRTSDFFVAEVSCVNSPSVYHEIGLAQALGRKVGLLVPASFLKDHGNIPWNLQGIKPIVYDDSNSVNSRFKLAVALCNWILSHHDWEIIDQTKLKSHKAQQQELALRP